MYRYEGLPFDKVLTKLYNTKDIERVMEWLENNQFYLKTHKNQDSEEQKSEGN